MDADTAIAVTGLGKKYMIGHHTARRDTLRDVVTHSVGTMRRTVGAMIRGRSLHGGDALEEFWALRDLDFEIKRGDVVGVIGRNGAGKSTLLKVLSRITEPTEGQVQIRGRVASLLEVGTGFHPELSGRENIFLNGAILGMGRSEIKRKFDEIVDFAGVERFIDTPVKRYSSGMYVRLAFSVAAHLEPEILIVDEVLAVGDSEFQQRCLGKMQDVAGHGRTVLFVSHNMAAVRQLCERGIYLVDGRCQYSGLIDSTISSYLGVSDDITAQYFRDPETLSNKKAQVSDAGIIAIDWNAETKRLFLRLSIGIQSPVEKVTCVEIRLKDHTGSPIAYATSGALNSAETVPLSAGRTNVTVTLDISMLAIGSYSISIDLTVPWTSYEDRVDDVICLTLGSEYWHRTIRPLQLDYGVGAILLESIFSS
jgi:lipopolysaccharide transport system ATP-binding protein